ncbi:hypothetical protein JXI42_11265 [bacterium]|nr:hypothetical protein [bacterium]
MHSSNTYRVLIIVCTALVLAISCREGVKRAFYDLPGAEQKILITGNTSDFKDQIMDKLIDKYKTLYQIEVMTYDMLDEVNYDDYAVVLVMDECQAWMKFTKKAQKVVDQIEDKGKIVLFITSDDPDWEYTYQGVDAVTSASEEDRVTRMFEDIAFEIDRILREE